MATSNLLLRSTLQAVFLSALSNILAQLLTQFQTSQPYSISPLPLSRYVLFSLLSAPPNAAWQSWLEARFPARPRSNADGNSNGLLSWRNTAAKFALDQTLGALLNTVAFVAGMDVLRGERDPATIAAHVRGETWPIIKAGQRVWPLVSLVSFTLVPLEYRAGFGGLVGVGWGVWLCLVEGRRGEEGAAAAAAAVVQGEKEL